MARPSNSREELHVIIQTPEAVIWEGDAAAVSSQNSAGPFDVLPDHANMITLIERQPISVVSRGKSQEFTFEKAIISVTENKISIYADIEHKNQPNSKVAVLHTSDDNTK